MWNSTSPARRIRILESSGTMTDLQLTAVPASAQDSQSSVDTRAVVGPQASLGPLPPKQQFWWGFFGGVLILIFRAWHYANALEADAPWPSLISFKTCLLCWLWLVFPMVSGLISRICDPHHRLIATFEGASAPALFLVIAKDFPL